MFYQHLGKEHTIVAVTTDDMVVTSKQIGDIEKLKAELQGHWKIHDLGEIQWFLGFKFKWDRVARTILINQCTYIEATVEKFQLTNVKPVSTPMETGAEYSKDQGPSTSNQAMQMCRIPYAEAIGSVLWPVMISRPDAAYAVGILLQFIQNPGKVHWEGLKQVIVYLGCMKDLWLTFGGHAKTLVEGYCNADWARQSHRHSILGYSFHMG
jgi:hypothetical protein